MQHAIPLPDRFLSRLAGFADLFTRPTWSHVLLLVAGAVLAPGRRTVTAALCILGREQEPDFCTYHRLLNRARWSSRAVAGRLLGLLVAAFLPSNAPVVIGLDDTIERRWGAKIRARGIYRDPVRSSKGHFVKASGLRWLCAMLLTPVPWAGRVLALPFLTVLAPSERFYAGQPRAAKTLLDWARQAALQIRRWLPGRAIVLVADSAFAALDFLAAVRPHLCVVTRLRLDASLFAPAPPRRPGRRGRPPLKGQRLPKLTQRLLDPATSWQPHTVALWYGRTDRRVDIATGAAVWYHAGLPPVPIRWLIHRSRCRTDRHAAVVRLPMAGRGHVRGGPRPPRRGKPAPMVRPRRPAHDARAARPVLARLPVGAGPLRHSRLHAQNGRLVPQGPPHLQRRHRSDPP